MKVENAGMELRIREVENEIEGLKREALVLQAEIDGFVLQQIQTRALLELERAKHRQFCDKSFSRDKQVTTSAAPHVVSNVNMRRTDNSEDIFHTSTTDSDKEHDGTSQLQQFPTDEHFWRQFVDETRERQVQQIWRADALAGNRNVSPKKI